jgi:hypothetical protein
MNKKTWEKKKKGMLKRYDNRIKDKLAEEGISREWMKDHLEINKIVTVSNDKNVTKIKEIWVKETDK